MADVALLCTDGSEPSLVALSMAHAVLDPGLTPVVVTVMDEPDPTLVTGTGFAGGVLSDEEYDRERQVMAENASSGAADAVLSLGIDGAETVILQGAPGPAICEYAREQGAKAILLGTRGRGGIKRAVLGSVSDHVVRHAPCAVIVVGPEATHPQHDR